MKNTDIFFPRFMDDRQKKIMTDAMKAYKKKVLASPEASKQFLIDLGILTPKGNVKKRYQHLITKK